MWTKKGKEIVPFSNYTWFNEWYINNCLNGCKRLLAETLEDDNYIDGKSCPIENCLIADKVFRGETLKYWEMMCGGTDKKSYKSGRASDKCAFYSDTETYKEHLSKQALKKENLNLFEGSDE